MTTAQETAEWFATLQQASFEGIDFSVSDWSTSGGIATNAEVQFGRGTQPRVIAPAQDRFPLDGYLTGGDALLRKALLRQAFAAGEGLLAHPTDGLISAICVQHDFQHRSGDVNFIALTLEFHRAQLPIEEETGSIPTTEDDAIAALAATGKAFDDEETASAQLEEIRSSLNLQPDDLTGVDFAFQITLLLLSSESAPATEVPRAIQRLGTGIRAAGRGELTEVEAILIGNEVLKVADRNNSPTLMDQRETFSLFLTELGSGAIATVRDGRGETVEALSVETGTEVAIVAQRNRDAILNWFARGTLIL